MDIKRSFVFFIGLFSLIACSTVTPQTVLPSQTLDTDAADVEVWIIFFNDSNPLLYAASGRIGIELDGTGLANVNIGEYVKVGVMPGVHKVTLKHWDVFTFTDKYTLKIPETDAYVRVSNSPYSTNLSLQTSKPTEFDSKYNPLN